MTIRIEIDGDAVTTEKGRTLVDVAAEAGVYIPTLCYLPEHPPALGTCRVCSVRVNGTVTAACAVKVSEGGMRVEVNDPRTRRRPQGFGGDVVLRGQSQLSQL